MCTLSFFITLLAAVVPIAFGQDFATQLPDAGRLTPGVDHTVDLNVSLDVELRYANDTTGVWMRVEVPGNTTCPSLYLVDTVDPVGPAENLTYFATKDAIGKARSPCAAIDYAYDRSTFGTDHSGRRGTVAEGWNATTTGKRVVYRTKNALSMDLVADRCGGKRTYMDRADLTGSAQDERVDFAVHVCQVGYYGPTCDGTDDTYASTCKVSRVTVIRSSSNASSATSLPTISRVFEGEISFQSFDTFVGDACVLGMTRGVIVFTLTTSGFDTLSLVQYMNPPRTNETITATPTTQPPDLDATDQVRPFPEPRKTSPDLVFFFLRFRDFGGAGFFGTGRWRVARRNFLAGIEGWIYCFFFWLSGFWWRRIF